MSNPGTNPAGGRKRIKTGIFFADAPSVVLVIRFAIRSLVPRMGWKTTVIGAVLIITLIVSPLVANTKMKLKAQNRATSNLVFYPYSAFSGETHFTTGMKTFVSLNAW